MINLLPPEQRRSVNREYKFRLGSAYLLLISSAIVIGIILLIPSYLFISTQETIAESELSALQSSTESTEREAITSELLVTKKYLEALTTDDNRAFIYSVIDKIALAGGGSIDITRLSYSRAELDQSSTMNVSGVATTREALLSFKRTLEENELFEEVVLPVSSLAEDADIEFSIQVKGTF